MDTPDPDLIRRILDGERDLYAVLVRRHQEKVLRLCAGLLTGRADVEDAAQEVFLKAYRALGRFGGRSAFSTWLYRLAYNHCLDALRRSKRAKTESWDALLERHGEEVRAPASGAPAGPAADLVRDALALLPPDHRDALVLREVQGLTYAEMTEVLDCSLDAVKARLRRARAGLADRLRHFLAPGDV
jgi:RNA polymerase sigma-70 factor (ECF subfamily)